MASEEQIREVLEDRLNSLDSVLPLGWESEDNPPSTRGFLEARLFRSPNERLHLDLGSAHRKSGFLQVAINIPRGGSTLFGTMERSANVADRVAQQIKDLFPEDLDLWIGSERLSITKEPDLALGEEGGMWWTVFVTVYYEIYS